MEEQSWRDKVKYITGVPNSRFEESIKYLNDFIIYAYRVRRDCGKCAVLCYTLGR